MALQLWEKLFHEYQYFKSFSKQVVLLKMCLQSLLCSFFCSTQVSTAWLRSSSIPRFPKQTTNPWIFNFSFIFYCFWHTVIFLKFPEDLSFNRNNIKFFPSFFPFLAPFLEYAIVTNSLTFFFLPLLPFCFFLSTPTVRFFLIPAVSYHFYLCPGAIGAERSGPPCCHFFSLFSSLLPLSNAETAAQYLYPMNFRDPKQVRRTWLKGADSSVSYFIK